MEKIQHFSIRKLSIGAASVLIGISFLGVKTSTVKADSLQNTSATELTKSKAANEAIKQDTGSNIEQEPTYDIKQDADSNIKQKPVSKINAKQITNDQPNTTQAPAKPATPKPNSNQQNTADLESKPQVPAKAKLQTNGTITSDEANRTEVATTTLTTTTNKKLSANLLAESKVLSQSNDTNGGFDEATWGKLNVNAWKGSVQGDYYQLNDYTGDANHVIVPNEADFEKAGISTSGKQVGVTSDLMHTIFRDKTTAQDATVAFSKTDNKQVKAIGTDWHNTWGHANDHVNGSWIHAKGELTKFDGSNLDISNVTNMSKMFEDNQISDLSPLSNWNVSNVIDMGHMFSKNHISDLNPLAGWKVDHVTDMQYMFYSNQISDLSPLANWKTGNVININDMFEQNHISDLSPLAGWKVDHVTDMQYMFYSNQISDLSPLANWKTGNVININDMFGYNQISDLSPLASWKTDKVTDMRDMFFHNRISDLSPLANWNVNNVTNMNNMFDNNVTTQTKNLQAKRVINFVYPDGYTGKKQDTITQTENVPQEVKVELITQNSKPSNNILDWVTKTETPEAPDPVYFQAYTVPEIKGLLEPDKTVISKQQVDITKPINVTVTYKLVDSNTNDAFALDPKNGLHEHANVNDNGGYNEDYWGKINVDDWNYTVNGNTITITGYKGKNPAKLIIPNGADFGFINGQDTNNSRVEISSSVMRNLARNAAQIGLSKTANKKVIANDSTWQYVFGYMTNESEITKDANSNIQYGSPNLTQMDLHNLDTAAITNMRGLFNSIDDLITIGDISEWNTSNVTDMAYMFYDAINLTNIGNLDNWDTNKVTNMSWMFCTKDDQQSHLTNIGDLSKWQTGNVTDMQAMFSGATQLTNIGNLDNWDTSKVTNMRSMFAGNSEEQAQLTNIGDLSKWNTSNVTNMAGMFTFETNLTDIGDLSKWNTSNVTDMAGMFTSANALRHLNISNWNLTKLANEYSLIYMFVNDPNLTVIANNLKLPTWYENEINDADYFWNNHIAVITNVPELIRATGDINNLKIDDQDASRSIFYDSKGSSDAIKVLTDANNQYIADYHKSNPTKVLKLADTVDQNDPIALANASFITVPAAVGLTIHFEDIDPNADKDSVTVKQELAKTVELSGHSGDAADLSQVQLPTNFELSGDLPSATFGDTDAVTIKLKHKLSDDIHQEANGMASASTDVIAPDGTVLIHGEVGIASFIDQRQDLVTGQMVNGNTNWKFQGYSQTNASSDILDKYIEQYDPVIINTYLGHSTEGWQYALGGLEQPL